MGALGGGAAGAIGGEILGDHPIIGGLLGAFVGDELEKRHKRHKREREGWGN